MPFLRKFMVMALPDATINLLAETPPPEVGKLKHLIIQSRNPKGRPFVVVSEDGLGRLAAGRRVDKRFRTPP